MMMGLFGLLAISIMLSALGNAKSAYIITAITLILCAFMYYHHADSVIGIRL